MRSIICSHLYFLTSSRINVTRKSIALVGAALLLDFTASSVVSAATAASYLAGELTLPFPTFVAAAVIVGVFALVSLSGITESARLAFVVLSFHVCRSLLFPAYDLFSSYEFILRVRPWQPWASLP
jgi:hypothetical protein